jgi:hypothetical protein
MITDQQLVIQLAERVQKFHRLEELEKILLALPETEIPDSVRHLLKPEPSR